MVDVDYGHSYKQKKGCSQLVIEADYWSRKEIECGKQKGHLCEARESMRDPQRNKIVSEDRKIISIIHRFAPERP